MKHLNLQLERLEQRIAPGGVSAGGGGSKSGGSKSGGSGSGGSGSHRTPARFISNCSAPAIAAGHSSAHC